MKDKVAVVTGADSGSAASTCSSTTPRGTGARRLLGALVRALPRGGTHAGAGRPGSGKSKLKIAKLNVDENPRTAGMHRVQSIPTLMLQRPLFLDRIAGALPKSELDAWIDRYV